jgi:hypothetical protein
VFFFGKHIRMLFPPPTNYTASYYEHHYVHNIKNLFTAYPGIPDNRYRPKYRPLNYIARFAQNQMVNTVTIMLLRK